ncbi:MAG: N-acetyl-D-Glu racemase DgcA [Halocynthiibacter sp.]
MIKVHEDHIKLAIPFRISRGVKTQADVITVEITRAGHVGRGEAVPYARYGETLDGVMDAIRTLPEDVTREKLQTLLPAGAARNAVDCALWDFAAKSTGNRVWTLLDQPAPAPAITAFTLSLNTPEEMERQAQIHAHRPLLKIKLGGEDDIKRLEAVRRGAPKSDIIIDANEGWTPDLYRAIAPHLVGLGVSLVEQPLPADTDEMLAELDRVLPVCADESCHTTADLEGLRGKYDVVNIKLDKTGGLSEAILLKKAATKMGFGVMVGCMVGSSLAMAPVTLLTEGAAYVDLDGPLLLSEDRSHPLNYDAQGVHPPDARLWG